MIGLFEKMFGDGFWNNAILEVRERAITLYIIIIIIFVIIDIIRMVEREVSLLPSWFTD